MKIKKTNIETIKAEIKKLLSNKLKFENYPFFDKKISLEPVKRDKSDTYIWKESEKTSEETINKFLLFDDLTNVYVEILDQELTNNLETINTIFKSRHQKIYDIIKTNCFIWENLTDNLESEKSITLKKSLPDNANPDLLKAEEDFLIQAQNLTKLTTDITLEEQEINRIIPEKYLTPINKLNNLLLNLYELQTNFIVYNLEKAAIISPKDITFSSNLTQDFIKINGNLNYLPLLELLTPSIQDYIKEQLKIPQSLIKNLKADNTAIPLNYEEMVKVEQYLLKTYSRKSNKSEFIEKYQSTPNLLDYLDYSQEKETYIYTDCDKQLSFYENITRFYKIQHTSENEMYKQYPCSSPLILRCKFQNFTRVFHKDIITAFGSRMSSDNRTFNGNLLFYDTGASISGNYLEKSRAGYKFNQEIINYFKNRDYLTLLILKHSRETWSLNFPSILLRALTGLKLKIYGESEETTPIENIDSSQGETSFTIPPTFIPTENIIIEGKKEVMEKELEKIKKDLENTNPTNTSQIIQIKQKQKQKQQDLSTLEQNKISDLIIPPSTSFIAPLNQNLPIGQLVEQGRNLLNNVVIQVQDELQSIKDYHLNTLAERIINFERQIEEQQLEYENKETYLKLSNEQDREEFKANTKIIQADGNKKLQEKQEEIQNQAEVYELKLQEKQEEIQNQAETFREDYNKLQKELNEKLVYVDVIQEEMRILKTTNDIQGLKERFFQGLSDLKTSENKGRAEVYELKLQEKDRKIQNQAEVFQKELQEKDRKIQKQAEVFQKELQEKDRKIQKQAEVYEQELVHARQIAESNKRWKDFSHEVETGRWLIKCNTLKAQIVTMVKETDSLKRELETQKQERFVTNIATEARKKIDALENQKLRRAQQTTEQLQKEINTLNSQLSQQSTPIRPTPILQKTYQIEYEAFKKSSEVWEEKAKNLQTQLEKKTEEITAPFKSELQEKDKELKTLIKQNKILEIQLQEKEIEFMLLVVRDIHYTPETKDTWDFIRNNVRNIALNVLATHLNVDVDILTATTDEESTICEKFKTSAKKAIETFKKNFPTSVEQIGQNALDVCIQNALDQQLQQLPKTSRNWKYRTFKDFWEAQNDKGVVDKIIKNKKEKKTKLEQTISETEDDTLKFQAEQTIEELQEQITELEDKQKNPNEKINVKVALENARANAQGTVKNWTLHSALGVCLYNWPRSTQYSLCLTTGAFFIPLFFRWLKELIKTGFKPFYSLWIAISSFFSPTMNYFDYQRLKEKAEREHKTQLHNLEREITKELTTSHQKELKNLKSNYEVDILILKTKLEKQQENN